MTATLDRSPMSAPDYRRGGHVLIHQSTPICERARPRAPRPDLDQSPPATSEGLPVALMDQWYAQEREHAARVVRSGRVLAAALLFWLASAVLAVWLLSR